jgi:ATP-dependent protease HslVU (ClpYQ) peptidase subunit
MTCIIGLKDKGDMYLCSDSAITIGGGLVAEVGSKMLKSETCLVGVAGARSVFNELADREYVFEGNFGAGHLNRIWHCLQAITPANTESEMLIAVNSQLFWVGNVAGWRMVVEDFECIGSGNQIAKGAMAMSEDLFDSPVDRLIEVLTITENHCNSVRGPFDIECIEGNRNE